MTNTAEARRWLRGAPPDCMMQAIGCRPHMGQWAGKGNRLVCRWNMRPAWGVLPIPLRAAGRTAGIIKMPIRVASIRTFPRMMMRYSKKTGDAL